MNEPTSWIDLAHKIAEEQQVLCIVNLKRHALGLHSELRKIEREGLFHISTNMCPAHRYHVLEHVRHRLAQAEPCRVISTQCVEAGVDLDFPSVFRAWGPLDSIAQAAGRCNRNGKAEFGKVYVFLPEEEKYPDLAYRQAADTTRIMLKASLPQILDMDSPDTFERYYQCLYDLLDPQNRNEELIKALNLREFDKVSRHYQVIEKNTINVLIPYDIFRFHQLAEEVQKTGLTGKWIAKAGPYAVALFKPKEDDPIFPYLNPAPIGKKGSSEEWFIYLNIKHYSHETGLVPPEATDCLIA